MSSVPVDRAALGARVSRILEATPATDIHTHLYDPAFGDLLLWGIDELLVYHYLVSEAFRWMDLPYDEFYALPKSRQAELVWDALFVRHSPLSEACRGVLTTLQAFGLDVRHRDLPALRRWFAAQDPGAHVTRCMELAGVKSICMTNSPFDDLERAGWDKGFQRDPRFTAALRIDPLLVAWGDTAPVLARWGYKVGVSLTEQTIAEVRRFLEDWSKRLQAQYLMVSLPPDFDYPADTTTARLLAKAVLPHCRDHGLPMALMIGVKRQVNPGLRMAGDGMGRSNLSALERLCATHPDTKFLATVLSRENQQELCVVARKFRNLHAFGCWWFTNVPHIIEDMTRMRLELIGLSVTPQHSDARVMDQVIYKWRHTRRILAKVLTEKYADVAETGWEFTDADIQRDAQDLLGGAFAEFCGRPAR